MTHEHHEPGFRNLRDQDGSPWSGRLPLRANPDTPLDVASQSAASGVSGSQQRGVEATLKARALPGQRESRLGQFCSGRCWPIGRAEGAAAVAVRNGTMRRGSLVRKTAASCAETGPRIHARTRNAAAARARHHWAQVGETAELVARGPGSIDFASVLNDECSRAELIWRGARIAWTF